MNRTLEFIELLVRWVATFNPIPRFVSVHREKLLKQVFLASIIPFTIVLLTVLLRSGGMLVANWDRLPFASLRSIVGLMIQGISTTIILFAGVYSGITSVILLVHGGIFGIPIAAATTWNVKDSVKNYVLAAAGFFLLQTSMYLLFAQVPHAGIVEVLTCTLAVMLVTVGLLALAVRKSKFLDFVLLCCGILLLLLIIPSTAAILIKGFFPGWSYQGEWVKADTVWNEPRTLKALAVLIGLVFILTGVGLLFHKLLRGRSHGGNHDSSGGGHSGHHGPATGTKLFNSLIILAVLVGIAVYASERPNGWRRALLGNGYVAASSAVVNPLASREHKLMPSGLTTIKTGVGDHSFILENTNQTVKAVMPTHGFSLGVGKNGPIWMRNQGETNFTFHLQSSTNSVGTNIVWLEVKLAVPEHPVRVTMHIR